LNQLCRIAHVLFGTASGRSKSSVGT
jgi:hypothetical protein